MQKEELTREALTALLKETEQAHAAHERTLGYSDPDWAAWYAQFLIDKLQNYTLPGPESGEQTS
jgi:hypothetical protein